MKTYSESEIQDHLSNNLKRWAYEGGMIKRDFEFGNFIEAFSFMTAVALAAEKLDHHPDWSNVYNRVSIALNTHSAGGITPLDFELASLADLAFSRFQR